ncbi:hypothetical protein E2E30_01400 [Sphingomonas sp. AAP5]|uniref:hypothetical protein n=1 Tax=Sphingomonas sp. AAP5 TaxID=1523415 RepID=UPI0010571EF7|nr:hypothetical protein [Sphingomonas sp. AAP5]QBM74548.1 hypothetical protein E2E30_01400 [Sphingomonas sp. AAP5]
MLFREFFPRLHDHAYERYGEVVTDRQFRDWREDGLLPGPAAPKGRGRGRSPDRHWPIASYRRALRICRYKSWGAYRQSQWWLGFWLSGEDIAPETIRAALKREFRAERRRNRSFVESNRWRESKFHTVADAERGGIVSDSEIAGWLALSGMTPDQYRRLSILQLDEFADDKAERLFHEMAPLSFPLDLKMDEEAAAAMRAEIEADITSEEIRRAWRNGHMADGANQPGKYLDRLPESDFAICLEILKIRERSGILNYGMLWIAGVPLPEQIVLPLFQLRASRAPALEVRISQLIRIAFEIDTDCRDGRNSSWRLEGAIESELKLIKIVRENASEFRSNLLKFISNSEANYEA